MTDQRRPVFVLTLQPVRSGPDNIRTLRAILKTLLRRYGWRCIGVREEPASTPTQ